MADETEPGESGQTGQPGPGDQRGPTRPWFPPSPGGFPPSPGEFPPSPGEFPPEAGSPPGPGSFGQTTGPGGQQPYGQGPDGGPPGQYGQAPYGQAPYGQAPYGQAPYGQAPNGQAPNGQAPYGQAPYGQQPNGGPAGQYGQAPYGGLPQYGGQGPYGGPPPAPKPGIIPLRPIGVSEMLDGAFTAIRRNPRATLGLGAVIMTIYGVIAAIIAPSTVTSFGDFGSLNRSQQASQAQLLHQLSNFGHEAAGLGVAYLLLFVASQILTGMLTVVIGRSVLGDRITAGEAWHRTLPRLPALFGATILYFLIIFGLWAVYLGIGLFMAAEHGPTGLIVPYFLLVGILVIGLTVWFWTSFILASQIAVLERAGPARALARSWRLVRHSFWKVFGITLLAELIVGIASAILQVPFSIPAALITSHAGNPLHPPILAVIIGTVGTIVSRTVTGALLAGVLVLLYVDLRMRREGLDMALRTAAGPGGAGGAAGTGAGDEFATVWRPPSGSQSQGQGPGHGQW